MKNKTVVVLGASPKPERYSNKAQKMLDEAGYRVVPVAPGHASIGGIPCYSSLKDFRGEVDTVTLYLSEKRLLPIVDEVLSLNPRRVIFNPGTESVDAVKLFESSGIECENACTLILLQTGQF